ncbi:MAG: hypothetical protein J1E39_08655 [Eubacterium sp.]|nr:hypothetical protein [Eubacterium sp.]
MSEGNNDLSAHIVNAAHTCAKRSTPYFTRFLSEGEQAELKYLRLPAGVFARYYAGEKNTEYQRAVLGVFPDRFSDIGEQQLDTMYPVRAVTVTYRRQDEINHRSVLGTLISLGIDRDTVGDIYIGDGTAIVYLYDTVSDYVRDAVRKIGGVGVEVCEGVAAELPERQYKELKLSVSSLRLDTVLGHIVSVSRGNALDKYIKAQRVSVNSVLCTDASKVLSPGDKIAVRGVGKFIFHSVDGEGRKGNIHITVKKYI